MFSVGDDFGVEALYHSVVLIWHPTNLEALERGCLGYNLIVCRSVAVSTVKPRAVLQGITRKFYSFGSWNSGEWGFVALGNSESTESVR